MESLEIILRYEFIKILTCHVSLVARIVAYFMILSQKRKHIWIVDTIDKKSNLLHRIISSLTPGIAPCNTIESLCCSDDGSFFLYCFDHIVTATRDMLAIGHMIESPSPE